MHIPLIATKLKTYHRHLIRLWSKNFLLAFVILNLLLLVGNLVKYGSKVGVANIFPLLPALLPSMIIYSLPMASLTSTISTLAKTRQLCEPITLAASGIGLQKLLAPFISTGIVLNILTLISFQWLQPMGENYKHHYLGNIGAKLLASELKKPQANLQLGNDSLHFFEQKNGAKSAVIQHRENGSITQEVFAHQAEVLIDRNQKLISLKTTGKVQVLNYGEGSNFGQFSVENFPAVKLPYPEKYSGSKSYRQWPLTKMWTHIKSKKADNLPKLKAYFYEKLALSISPLLLVIAAFPLGFLGKDSSQTTGFFIGLGLIFLIYYPLLILGKKMVLTEIPLPFIWPQLANISLLIIGFLGIKKLNHSI
jgi:lipopolysaccharide export LptBFGC system permease protein LptF